MEDSICVIDGSHMSSHDFTVAVIELAMSKGFTNFDIHLYQDDLRRLDDENIILTNHEVTDIMEGLDFLYYDALDWLNENALDDGVYWDVEDQCLYLSPNLENVED